MPPDGFTCKAQGGKHLLSCLLLALALPLAGYGQVLAPPEPAAGAVPVEVYFSPSGGCTEAVVRELSAARSTVLVQAYSFTSAPIAKALVDAHMRGVQVQVILDKSQRTEKYSEADFLVNAGIPTFIDAQHPIAHNKVMVIDGQTVITGSFNFTRAADEGNAENLLEGARRALRTIRGKDGSVLPGGGSAGNGERTACRHPDGSGWLRCIQELPCLPPGRLQVGGQDRRQEPGPVRHPGGSGCDGKAALRGVPTLRMATRIPCSAGRTGATSDRQPPVID